MRQKMFAVGVGLILGCCLALWVMAQRPPAAAAVQATAPEDHQ